MKEEEKEGVAVLVAALTLTMSLDEEAGSFASFLLTALSVLAHHHQLQISR